MYLADYRKTDEFKGLEGSNTERMQHVASVWKGLGEEEKAVYVERATQRLETYKSDIGEYRAHKGEAEAAAGGAAAVSSSSSSSSSASSSAAAAAPKAAKPAAASGAIVPKAKPATHRKRNV